MASPKGEYTPQSGPLAGTTYSSYYRYQVARSAAIYGYSSYGQERAARETSQNEHMYRVLSNTMRADGAKTQEINQTYLKMRQANGGRQPTRNQVRNTLQQGNFIAQDEEPDWDQGS